MRLSQELSYLFMRWRNPGLLFDYYRVHNTAFTRDVQAPYQRFLRALLGVSGENVDQLRYCDPCNRRHLERFPPEVTRPWVEGRTAKGQVLPGYSDPQTLFMLGEDAQSCMMVKPRQRNTNRGLLSTLLHGNVRVVGVKDASGKLRTRAIVKLLEDQDTQRPVLYMESPIHLGRGGADAVVELYDQAAELGMALGLPVVYAVAPNAKKYCMGNTELAATSRNSDCHAFDEDKSDEVALGLLRKQDFTQLLDYSNAAPYVWIDGIKDPSTGRFVDSMTPVLLKRSEVGEISHEKSAEVSPDSLHGTAPSAGEASTTAEMVDYYVNGFRLPGTIEYLYSQDVKKNKDLPDFKCSFGKSINFFNCMAGTMPQEVGRMNTKRGREISVDSPHISRKGRDTKKKSMHEMLAERQKKINVLSGRAERVEKEKEEARDKRKERILGLE